MAAIEGIFVTPPHTFEGITDVPTDGNECILRREIHKSGRNRCFLNDASITHQQLTEIGVGAAGAALAGFRVVAVDDFLAHLASAKGAARAPGDAMTGASGGCTAGGGALTICQTPWGSR